VREGLYRCGTGVYDEEKPLAGEENPRVCDLPYDIPALERGPAHQHVNVATLLAATGTWRPAVADMSQ
jgi:hypothetical protein